MRIFRTKRKIYCEVVGSLSVLLWSAILPAQDVPSWNPASYRPLASQQPSSIRLSGAPNPSAFGQAVTLTANVSPASATGSITFLEGSTVLGTAVLSAGTGPFNAIATLVVPALSSGLHTLTALYPGDAVTAASTSSGLLQTVNPLSTSTTLKPSANPLIFGQTLALTAAVTPAEAVGSVTFFDGSTALGTVAVSGGLAVFSTAALATGTHSLSASFGGSTNYAASVASVSEVIGPPPAISSILNGADFSPPPLAPGSAATILGSMLATAAASAPSPVTTSLAGVTVLVNGVAAPLLSVSPGQINFQVPYGTAVGSAKVLVNNNLAPSNTFALAIAATAPGIVGPGFLNADGTPNTNANKAVAGTTVSVVLTGIGAVTPPVPDGTITSGALAAGTGTATVGGQTATVVSLSVSPAGSPGIAQAKIVIPTALLTGTYPVVISVNGQPSAPANIYVSSAPCTVSLASLLNPAAFGQTVRLTATVGCPRASGNVTFQDGSVVLGTAPLSGGSAVFDVPVLAVGSHSLSASYLDGTAQNTSPAVGQTVTVAATSTLFTSSVNPSTFGQSVTLTATVSSSTATGTVTFKEGTNTLGTGTLSNGIATFSTSGLSVAAHSLTALYAGDSNDAASTSSVLSLTVNPAVTSTGLTSSVNPSTFGQSVTLTATVSPSSATGTVTFKDGTNTLGTGTLSNGIATFSTSGLSVAAHSLTALYAGDSNDAASTSSVLSLTVNPAVTSTGLTSSVNPSTFGQSVTLTATVSPSSATGTVTFKDGTNTLGTGTLSNGIATFSTSGLSVAAHSLTALYAGDSNDAASTSSVLSLTVNPAVTSTGLTSSVNPSTFGQSVTLTATVSPSSATGTVTFKDGTNTLGTGTLSNGIATFSTSGLSVAAHSLTALYAGDSNDAASTSSVLSLTVNPAVTSTGLTSSVNPSTFGQSVTLTTTVSPSSATGTVTFKDGTNTLGTGTLSNGIATFSTSGLSVAVHSLTALYAGDSNDAASTSSVLSLTVNPAVTSTGLTSSVNPSTFGQSVTLTATVSPSSATGTVTFKDGTNTLGTGTLSNGIATFSTSGLSVAAHSLTALYAGDSNDAASTSSVLSLTVNPAATTSVLSTSSNPSFVSQAITLTARVRPSAATGSITFSDGATPLGTVALSSGVAVLSVSTLAHGSHNLLAAYSGDSSYAGSVSAGSGPALDFTTALPGTLPDVNGQGTGFPARLSGTGGSIAANDPHLTLRTATSALTLQSTPVDTNGQPNPAISDFIGFPLAAAGVSLNEDFQLSAAFRNVQYGQNFDQFGLFAGTAGNNLFRGGARFLNEPTVFSTWTTGGAELNAQQNTGLAPAIGDDIVLTLSRTSGVWALTIQNLTTPAKSGSIPIVQPTYLNGVSGLVAGVFANNAANTASLSETVGSFVVAGGTQTVNLQPTTISVSSSPNPSLPAQGVTLTATLPASAATGVVTFLDGTTNLGTAALNAGSAVLQTTALSIGTHSLAANYAGDAAFAGSTSAAYSHVVNQTPTNTNLTATPNPASFGQTVTFTATVFPSGATGTVVFKDGSATLGSAALSGGLATFTTAALPAGSHSITAQYGGDVADAASISATVNQNVNAAVTTTTLSSSLNPALVSQAFSLRAVVTPSGATGSVTFKDGATTLGTNPLNGGVATITVSTLTYGAHSLTATYSGDQNYAPGSSAVLSQTMNFPPLVITTSGLPSGQTGQSFGPVSLGASGGSGSYTWSAGGLPEGISLSAAGVLSGTPTSGFNGQISATVTDGISNLTASANLSLTILAVPLSISGPASLGSVVLGNSVSASYTASGGTPPYTWSISGVSGIAVDSSGNVAGKPGQAGNFALTLTVTDSKSGSVSRTLTLSVFGITSASLPPATTTTDYSAAVTATGGTTPYTYTISGLPSGITASGGTLSGRAASPGSYPVSITIREGGGLSVSASLTLTVTGPSALTIYSSSLGDATAGQPYSASLSATGGSTPYMWSQSGGVLPGGLSLSSSGTISGMPSAPGSYNIGVQVRDASGGTAVGSVSLNVRPAPLQFSSPSVFPSGVQGLDYPTQILTASGGMPPYTFGVKGALPPGLSLSNGQVLGTPTVAGDSSFTLTVTDSAAPPATALLGQTVTIRPAASDLVLSSGNVAFSLTQGTSSVPTPSSVGVASSLVSQSITYSTSSSAPWISVSGGSSTPDVVQVGLNSSALALTPQGSPYSGTVTVSCTSSSCIGKSQSIMVSLTVTSAPPQLSVGTVLLSFASTLASPQATSAGLTLVNSGGGQVKVSSVTSDASWLTVGSSPGSISPGAGANVNVTADPSGLGAGYYRATITVASDAGSATVAATLFISGAATLSLGPAGTQLSMPQGGALGNSSGSFTVSTSGTASVTYNASVLPGSSWLSVTGGGAGAATSATAGTVGYAVDSTAAARLAPGAYYGTIRVTGSGVVNSPQDFQVILNILSASAPVIPDLQPAGLVFISSIGGAASTQTVNVYASSRTDLSYQASASTDDGGKWVGISPTQGSASASGPGVVKVTADPSGLKAGAYRGIVSFAFGSAVRAVNITLIVQPAQSGPNLHSNLLTKLAPAATGPVCAGATLVPTQTGLVSNFSAPTSWPTPLAIRLFDSCGSSVSSAQIVATFTNGDPPLPLTAVNSSGGTYSGTWTPRKTSSQVSVTASVTAPGYPATTVKIAGQVAPNTAPVLAPNGTGDVFHPQVGAGLGPGNIVQIYGSGLASLSSASATLPLPTAMNGTTVVIGGVRAPLFYISPTQINAQIPFELTAGNQYQLIVNANGALTTPQTIQLNSGTPAILNFNSGAVVAQHLDGSLILDSSPAVPGEYVVIYSSGLGATDIPVVSGMPSPADPPARVADPPTLMLNRNPVTILFSGLTPGLVGLYQVNFQIPPDMPSGNYELLLTQSGTPSNKTVLAVKAP